VQLACPYVLIAEKELWSCSQLFRWRGVAKLLALLNLCWRKVKIARHAELVLARSYKVAREAKFVLARGCKVARAAKNLLARIARLARAAKILLALRNTCVRTPHTIQVDQASNCAT
jgi:hypothetical protein